MKLPRWIRQWAACIMVSLSGEVGGVLHNYRNGRWDEIASWGNEEEAEGAMELTWNMINSGKDDIYVVGVKSEGSVAAGYFVIYDSNCNVYRRDFWAGIYEPYEALEDIDKRCRKIAKKMGYRDPDPEETV